MKVSLYASIVWWLIPLSWGRYSDKKRLKCIAKSVLVFIGFIY